MKNERYAALAQTVENALTAAFDVPIRKYNELYEAMKYAVLGGGKRLRGVLMLECGRICGLSQAQMMPFVCAIEMIHASTLIHDDLPCMDDDDFRRGKPSCHKKFGEDVALLAGDALYSFALEYALSGAAKQSYDGQVTAALSALISLAGANGVFGGQILDKKYENELCSKDDLIELHMLKTGALFSACCRVPCLLAHADISTEKALRLYIKNLGLAFQVKDDLLDVEGNFETLGKAVGADCNKSTFISVFGLAESKKYLQTLVTDAKVAIDTLGDNELLLWIADFVVNRDI